MEKHTNTPKLRFLEFTEQWKVIQIQELLNCKWILSHLDGNHGGLYPKNEEFAKEGVPYISANDFVDGTLKFNRCKFLPIERAKQFKKGIAIDGDVLFAHNATVGPTALLNTNLEFVILSTTATYFRCDNKNLYNQYLEKFFKTDYFVNQYTRVMAQSTRNQVPISMQRTFYIQLPILAEQTKIANFLTAVDDKLIQLKKKKSLLEQYKKGVMQKLFSQELRFKDENGEDFEDWEEKKIKDVFRFKQGIQCSVENQYSERGENMQRFIRIIDLTSTNEPIRYIDSPSNEHHIKPDDLFMVRYGTPGLVGFGYEGVIANNLFRIIPVKEVVNKFYYFVFTFLSQELSNLASSSTMPALSFGSLEVLSVPEPSLPEQTKIANFLSAIDDKISHCSMQIEKMEGWKKGLLQGMFV